MEGVICVGLRTLFRPFRGLVLRGGVVRRFGLPRGRHGKFRDHLPLSIGLIGRLQLFQTCSSIALIGLYVESFLSISLSA
jgi:hypothetical protein